MLLALSVAFLGMTDTAFRRLVKRHGGCGLVVTEMVSSEGLVRGIDRTLEYAEYTEEERPISIQIFGGDPAKMAAAAQIVEGMGADMVDVNMGCPVPKIAKHNAGCSLMREPEHAAGVIAAMVRAVKIPVTVKMRAGWNDEERNAPTLARMVEDAGASAIAVHGRTAAQSYSGSADWDLVAQIADDLTIPVFGSGDCIEPEQIVARIRSGVEGVLVGRGVLRNPWILAQATDLIVNVYQWNPHCNKVTKMSVISKVLMRRQDTARDIGHFEPHHGRVMDAILGCIEKTRQALPYARGG